MRQTVVVLTVIMALLLVVSGVIVAGSLQQSELLVSRVNQVNELNTKLRAMGTQQQELKAKLEDAETALMDAKAKRDEALLQLKDALGAVEAASGELSRRDDEQKKAEAVTQGEMSDLRAQLTDKEQAYDQLMGKFNTLTAEHQALTTEKDTAIAQRDELSQAQMEKQQALEAARLEMDALRAELQTVKASALERDDAIAALTAERQAFSQVVDAWLKAQGDGEAQVFEQAKTAFAEAYPDSPLTLPELKQATPAADKAQETKETPSTTPGVALTPTPRPTFAPIKTSSAQ